MTAVDDPYEDEGPGKFPVSKEFVFLVVVALGLAFLMKTFLVQAFFIPSPSMEKTLHGCDGCTGDRVLVNKVVYDFRDIHRGEIVVFNGKHTNFPEETLVETPGTLFGRIKNEVMRGIGMAPEERDFIKRVIGVEGDTVACCVDDKVTINGEPIDEPYVYLLADETEGARPQEPFDPVVVPPDHLFVMGDNRHGSSDSRRHGPIPESSVVGRAFAVFYPMGRMKVLRVPETFQRHGPAAASHAPEILGFAMAVPVSVVRRRLRAND